MTCHRQWGYLDTRLLFSSTVRVSLMLKMFQQFSLKYFGGLSCTFSIDLIKELVVAFNPLGQPPSVMPGLRFTCTPVVGLILPYGFGGSVSCDGPLGGHRRCLPRILLRHIHPTLPVIFNGQDSNGFITDCDVFTILSVAFHLFNVPQPNDCTNIVLDEVYISQKFVMTGR